MNISKPLAAAFPVVMLLFASKLAVAQTRSTTAFGQTNQQTQSPFGNQGQSSALGQAGQQGAGQFGGQATNRSQPQVGGQDGFVGTDAAQIRNQQRSGRQQRRALFDMAVESLNEMRESRRERNAQRNAPAPVRVRLRPLFTVEAPSSLVVATRAQSALDRAIPDSASGTKVTVAGSSAIIEGSVASEYERKLAAKMISLTPGIYAVNNQLAIVPTANP